MHPWITTITMEPWTVPLRTSYHPDVLDLVVLVAIPISEHISSLAAPKGQSLTPADTLDLTPERVLAADFSTKLTKGLLAQKRK